MALVHTMYIKAIKGAASNTERATSFLGLRHSSAKTEHWSNPLRENSAILVKTFRVSMEAAGKAKENDWRAAACGPKTARPSRKKRNRNVTTVSIPAKPLNHFARCNPYTFTTPASTHTATVTNSAAALLVAIHAAPGPPEYASPLVTCKLVEEKKPMI